ncbi:MAG TPA: ABC transporter permease [Bellilinea sp.]|nr:ABC transporter permease [Bellilinea sp.]
MKKFWLVFKHEYMRHVLTKRFILAVLSVPFFIALSIGLGFLSVVLGTDYTPVGIVDRSGVLTDPLINPHDNRGPLESTKFNFYSDETQAQSALDNEEIQGFYVIGPDYLKDGLITLTAIKALGSEVTGDFATLLRANLIKTQPADLRVRLLDGPEITVHSLADSRSVDPSNILAIIMPILAGILFVVVINISGGYLLQAVVEEKENRIMEIILTSVSPDQLMAGKIMGNLSVGLTQLLIWLAAAGIGVVFFTNLETQLGGTEMLRSYLLVLVVTFIPAFIMIAALMAMVGATATEAREAQQIAGFFSIPIFMPLWFITAILERPDSALAVGFSLFPLTSPLTLPVRVAISTVPAWQIALSLGILVVCAVGAVWLASRAFRLGMLRYGKKLSLRELVRGTD